MLILLFLSLNLWSTPDFVVEIPQALGALSLILLFVILFSMHVTAITEMGERTGYPLFSIVAILAIFFSFQGLERQSFNSVCAPRRMQISG